MQFPMTGPAGGDVMAPPQTEPSTSCPLSPTPLSPPSPPPPSPSPTPLNPPLSPFPPGPASPLPALSQSGRPQCTRHLPARYQDIYPKPPLPATLLSSPVALLSPPAASMPVPSETAAVQRITLIVQNRFQTDPNTFGLWKEYLYRPSYDPDAFISPEDLYHPHTSAIILGKEGTEETLPTVYSNETSELLMNWQNSSSNKKSNEETT